MKITIEISDESLKELNQIAVEASTTVIAAVENIVHGWTTVRVRGKYESAIRKLDPIQLKTLFDDRCAETVINDANSILEDVER